MVLLAAIPNPPPEGAERVPLVVDLDGTLLRTNSLIESILPLVRMKPWTLPMLPFWWLKGRAYLKRRVAGAVTPDVRTLPYRCEVVEFLRDQKHLGRSLILATGADEKLATEINRELGLFDGVMASDGRINLVGKHKRERLIAVFGLHGFDYIGNDRRDVDIWCAARRALVASAAPGLVKSIADVTPVEKIFKEPPARWQDYLDALRPTHWVKNLLLFVPLAAAHRMFEPERLERVLLAFIAFDLCASGVYLLNDLLDLPADRCRPHKKERMLASGRIPLTYALSMMPLLMLGAFGLALHLSLASAGIMGLYTALMIAYSMKLKDIVLIDVFVLAGGYALRVAEGAAAAQLRVSAWLLTLCVFLFFSLALIKRYAELVVLEAAPAEGPLRARGYMSRDKGMLVAQGIASGYLGVMVLALYTNTEISQRLYARHDVFWGVCLLLLYWVSYVWMAALRGRIVGDPVMFALRDRVSCWTIAGMGLLAALSL